MLAFINLSSPSHLLVILAVALLLFGNRLPEVARSLGRAFNEFKRGLRDVDDEIKRTDGAPSPPREREKLAAPPSSSPQDTVARSENSEREQAP